MEDDLKDAHIAETPDRHFFDQIPWCSKMITNPSFTYMPMYSRLPKPSTTEDAFFAETIKSPTTIPHCLSLYRTPSSSNAPVTELRTLMQLGSHLNGWPQVVHGGIQSFVLDEIMACLCSTNARVSPGGAIKYTTVTGELKVRFVRTVRSPIVVLVTARLKDVKGRKVFTEGTITDEFGTVLASAEALFIVLDPEKAQKL